jgi:hypothetical protein
MPRFIISLPTSVDTPENWRDCGGGGGDTYYEVEANNQEHAEEMALLQLKGAYSVRPALCEECGEEEIEGHKCKPLPPPVMDLDEFLAKYGVCTLGLVVRDLIRRAPPFLGDTDLAKQLGVMIADLEGALEKVQRKLVR